MKFKTKRDSETGLKFQAVADKIIEVRNSQKAIAEELGVYQWREGYWAVVGGISACIFKEAPDRKVWMNVNNSNTEWMPKENIKVGKELMARFRALPIVSSDELNSCIGFNGSPFKTIGFSQMNEEYFGFTTREDWNVQIPVDCEEITVSAYNELFG